jgi:hypothetical protein
MTLDHIAEYTILLPVGNHPLRIIGRIAAPLFLYLITVSAHHTRSKLQLFFRLYIAHIVIGCLTLLLKTVGQDYFGIHGQFSVLSTFAYTVLYIYFIENIITCRNTKDKRKSSFYIFLGITGMTVPIFGLLLFQNDELCSIFIPNILTIPYSPIFVIMGVCWYFVKTPKWQAVILAVFSCFSLIGSFIISRASVLIFMDYFNSLQFWMLLFLPFIFLYNGQKGKSLKYFFYIYYPLHVFLLMFIGQALH